VLFGPFYYILIGALCWLFKNTECNKMLGTNNIRIFLINVMKSLMMTIADVATHTAKSYYYKQPVTGFKESVYKNTEF
jgi:hypothetical protein